MANQTTTVKKKRASAVAPSPFKQRTRPHSFILEVIMTSAKMFFVIALLVGVGLSGLVIGAAKAWVETMPILDLSIFDDTAQTSYIYDGNGDLIMTFKGLENRVDVNYDELPENLINAIIAIEDQRYWSHNGVDMRRLAGVFIGLLTDTDSMQGGSTITQQLIKNTILTDAQTFKRKIQEVYLAIELEQKISKEDILTEYVNEVFLGGSNYGVKVAANDYFGKELNELSLRECAAIAGIIRSPNKYNPRKCYYTLQKPEVVEERADLVLKNMHDQKLINDTEYKAAMNDKLHVLQYSASSSGELCDNLYYVEYAIYDVVTKMLRLENLEDNSTNRSMMENKLRTGGYKIYTSLNPEVQDEVQRVITEWEQYPRMRSAADGVYKASLGNGEYLEVVQPQAAATIIDWHTGQIVAIVGGRSVPTGWKQTHRAYNFSMPVGSSLKPLSVYGPALDLGASPGSPVMNLPIQIKDWDSETGYPENYEGGAYTGVVTMRQAINQSLNTAAAQALMTYVGIDNSVEYLLRLGVKESHINATGAGLALGSSGLSTVELAGGFSAIANGGVYLEPVAFSKVCEADGSIYIDAYDVQINRQVYKESTAWMLVDLLLGCCDPEIEGSTGSKAKFGKMAVAGKTGTNSDYRGVTFAGMTGYLVGAVWIGADTYKPLVTGASGGSYAAPLWAAMMAKAHKVLGYTVDQPIRTKSAADVGLFKVEVCGVSGMKPTEACYHDINGYTTSYDYFLSGTEPQLECNMHRMVRLCTLTHHLPTDSCYDTEYVGVVYLPEGHPLRTGVSTVVQEYFTGSSTERDTASIGYCAVCCNNQSEVYIQAEHYQAYAQRLLENKMHITAEQIVQLTETTAKLTTAMISGDVEKVQSYTNTLKRYCDNAQWYLDKYYGGW